MKAILNVVFMAAIAIFLVNAEDPVKCGRDITQATTDLTAVGLKIAIATTDCSGDDPDLQKCENDIDDIVNHLLDATDAITAAVYDCGDGNETVCTQDVVAVLDNFGNATIAIADAAIDCQNLTAAAQCSEEILEATNALTQAGIDIAKATVDCA